MKIEDLKTYLINDWLIVEIITDSGITGIGQGTFWGQPKATEQVIKEFKNYLIGSNPMQTDYHYQYLNRSSSFRASSVYAALSAVDNALWDIKGKHHQAPVYSLIGGEHRDKIRMWALCLDGDRDRSIELVDEAVKQGHTAIKIDPFPPNYATWTFSTLINTVTDTVGAVRESVGKDIDIVVEVHRKLGPAEAIALCQKLEEFNLLLIEDPIPPDSVDSMADVSKNTTIPIATGERLHTIYEFREILSKSAARDLKLDAGLHGGITQCKKISALAESYHATVSPHNAWGPILTAIHVQLAASIPNFLVLEYRYDARDEIVSKPLQINNGYIKLPDSPGLGIEFDNLTAKQYSYEPRNIDTALRSDRSVGFR